MPVFNSFKKYKSWAGYLLLACLAACSGGTGGSGPVSGGIGNAMSPTHIEVAPAPGFDQGQYFVTLRLDEKSKENVENGGDGEAAPEIFQEKVHFKGQVFCTEGNKGAEKTEPCLSQHTLRIVNNKSTPYQYVDALIQSHPQTGEAGYIDVTFTMNAPLPDLDALALDRDPITLKNPVWTFWANSEKGPPQDSLSHPCEFSGGACIGPENHSWSIVMVQNAAPPPKKELPGQITPTIKLPNL